MPQLPPPTLRRVCILATDKTFASTLLQAKDFFHLASLRYGRHLGHGLVPAFESRLVSPTGTAIDSFSGVRIEVDAGLEDADIIVLPAFWEDVELLRNAYPQVVPWLKAQHARGAAICGEASGVFWMAEAGLLDGKEATTYWRFFDTFRKRYPEVSLNTDRHLTDAGNLYCAAGLTSAQ